MPSAEYYRRQAETCLRLSLLSSDIDETKRLLELAEQYKARAENAASSDGQRAKRPSVGSGLSSEKPDRHETRVRPPGR
jgi:hypothetical protein